MQFLFIKPRMKTPKTPQLSCHGRSVKHPNGTKQMKTTLKFPYLCAFSCADSTGIKKSGFAAVNYF
jgi:hypothetical protein